LVPEGAAFARFRRATAEEKEQETARAVESVKQDYWLAEREFGMAAAARMPHTSIAKQY